MAQAPAKPESAGSVYVNIVAALALLFALYACRETGRQGVEATLVGIITYLLALWGVEAALRRPAMAGNGLSFKRLRPDYGRVGFKLVGLAACFGMVAYCYWMFPEYYPNFLPNEFNNGFYVPYGSAVMLVLPVVALLAVPYTLFLDGVMLEPKDSYYWLGRFILRRPVEVSRVVLLQLLGMWLVRGFFLALLFIYAHRAWGKLVDYDFALVVGMTGLYRLTYDMALAMGLMITVAAMAAPLRLMGTHIRSIDPTLFGWWICFFFYQPFKTVSDQYIAPRGENDLWIIALMEQPFLQGLWAGVLIVALLGAVFADVALGGRCGQLSHQGIVTNGPYRFFKHPSYFMACVQFVLIYFPLFRAEQGGEVWRSWLALLLLFFVYYLRARTEERHLSRDEKYVQYALWMNEHGALAWLGKLVPGLKYRAPQQPAQPDYKGIS